MEKLSIILGMLLFCSQAVFAVDDTNVQPEQKFVDNKAVISVQKQPATENTQKQGVKNNWFCIVVQVNGKVLDSSVPNTK